MSVAEITVMTEEDLEPVHDIEERVYPQPWSAGLFLSELKNPDKRVYLVARVRGKIAGYGGIMLIDGEAHITTLAVDGKYRRRGIGALLTLRIVEFALLKRVHWLSLEVRESNKAARALYEKFGFRKIGVRKKYYSDGENAVIMWTNDIQSDEYREMLADLKAKLI